MPQDTRWNDRDRDWRDRDWRDERGRYEGRGREDYGGPDERWRRMHRDPAHEGPAGYNDSGPIQGGWTFEGPDQGYGAGDDRGGQGRYPRRTGRHRGGADYPYGPHTPYGYRGRNEYDDRGRGGYGAGGPERREHEHRSWVERAGDRLAEAFGNEGEHRGRGPKGYRRSDERIREDINDRLTDDPWLDATAIEVAVKDCEVTLSGTIRGRDDKRRAENLAESVSGVNHVQNNLRVDQPRPDRPAPDTSPARQA